jgi:hypothetical protein
MIGLDFAEGFAKAKAGRWSRNHEVVSGMGPLPMSRTDLMERSLGMSGGYPGRESTAQAQGRHRNVQKGGGSWRRKAPAQAPGPSPTVREERRYLRYFLRVLIRLRRPFPYLCELRVLCGSTNVIVSVPLLFLCHLQIGFVGFT